MKRRLIVNADDCNLTSGVTRAILECHDRGIVSSTTFLITHDCRSSEISALIKRKKLGIGLHLNVTAGKPVLPFTRISSLLNSSGQFDRNKIKKKSFKRAELLSEYEAQIQLFRKVFRRLPTHLDTHHHLHRDEVFLKVLLSAAKKYRLPIRRPQFTKSASVRLKASSTPMTDSLWGDLNPEKYWRRPHLEKVIRGLPEGVHEMMCHPGVNDAELKKISSFRTGRSIERRIFRCAGLRRLLAHEDIELTNYGMCYTYSNT